ncbi:MAG: site-specific integrase, partial [Prevotella sp.]|nr:site-specific integrase [Prevotella sp.]
MKSEELTTANIVKRYLRYLKLERNYSANTLEAYRHDLDWLIRYAHTHQLDILQLKLDHLTHFSATLHEQGISPRSQARLLSGVRSFYRYLLMDGYIEADPTELLEMPRIGSHLPDVLSAVEVDMLQQAIDLTKWEGQRNKAIIEVLFSCGLRVSELVSLKLSNLYLHERFLRIMGKGSKERLVPISSRAIEELELWFTDR